MGRLALDGVNRRTFGEIGFDAAFTLTGAWLGLGLGGGAKGLNTTLGRFFFSSVAEGAVPFACAVTGGPACPNSLDYELPYRGLSFHGSEETRGLSEEIATVVTGDPLSDIQSDPGWRRAARIALIGGWILPISLPRLVRRARLGAVDGLVALRAAHLIKVVNAVGIGLVGLAFDWVSPATGSRPVAVMLFITTAGGVLGIVVATTLPKSLTASSPATVVGELWGDLRQRALIAQMGAFFGAVNLFVTADSRVTFLGVALSVVALAATLPTQRWLDAWQHVADRAGLEIMVSSGLRTVPPSVRG